MQVITVTGTAVEVEEREILRVAGQVFERRRRSRSGPIKQHACRWCGRLIAGRKLHSQHERECASREEYTPVEAGDMLALAWEPAAPGD